MVTAPYQVGEPARMTESLFAANAELMHAGAAGLPDGASAWTDAGQASGPRTTSSRSPIPDPAGLRRRTYAN